MDHIKFAVEDRLHQPYRIGLIPDGKRMMSGLYDLGVDAIFISGSGSTLLSIIKDISMIEKAKELCKCFKTTWDVRLLEADNDGALVNKA
jgi:homoserine kinase